jgi:UDP-N-acetyl-D-galactosamine dehydrogenase
MQSVWKNLESGTDTIGVVGLGYVGLPLACLLAEKFNVVGFDINKGRVEELKSGHDVTREVEERSRLLNPKLKYTCEAKELKNCAIVIVAVPTPVDRFKKPDLFPVEAASKTVGQNLRPGAVVVFESTVYPGVTEDVCGPILAKESGLVCGKDFFMGYSPERVNPGDREHTIDKIVKVVSGSTPEVADLLCKMYGAVVKAGIHKAPNIKTAEAAKVIENTQRDLNIALINELSTIFHRVGIDTLEVLEAAGTKWNFLKFQPGLVGGHCIGVDPYYLTHLSESLNIHPQVILAGRRINDGMGAYVANQVLKMILSQGSGVEGRLKVGILGVTFKENVPDLRNTKVIDVIDTLEANNVEVFCVDPVAESHEFQEEYGRKLTSWNELPQCDAIVLAVKHKVFLTEYPLNRLQEKLKSNSKVLIDLKGVINRDEAKTSGVKLWRL